MADQVEQQAAQKRGFFYGLLSDENGLWDEANFAFFVAFFVITLGAFINAFSSGEFPMLAYAGAVGALIPVYRVSRGDLRRDVTNTATGPRGSSDNTAP